MPGQSATCKNRLFLQNAQIFPMGPVRERKPPESQTMFAANVRRFSGNFPKTRRESVAPVCSITRLRDRGRDKMAYSTDSADTSVLLERIAEGQSAAFERLLRIHRPYLKRIIEMRMEPDLRARARRL